MKSFSHIKFNMVVGKTWIIEVEVQVFSGRKIHSCLEITPVSFVSVEREAQACLPIFSERKWQSGNRLEKLKAAECSLTYALQPDSVVVESGVGKKYEYGKDYYLDTVWGAIGRTVDSSIDENETVYVSYAYYPYRLDAIIIDSEGNCSQKIGKTKQGMPALPMIDSGETLIGSIYFDRICRRISDSMLYPYIEPVVCPDQSHSTENQLSRILQKLRDGDPVKVLAWGDSVTASNYIEVPENRWVNLFAHELRRRFGKSEITVDNLGWPGKPSVAFLNEPDDSPYHYERNVMQSGADLIIFEFVNDASLSNESDFMRIYNRIGHDLKKIGADVIIVLPHPVRPDWMGLGSQKNITEDPRPYIKHLRKWAEEAGFAIADVSSRFLQLWKEAIPYNSLMVNNINHPDVRGMNLYAEVLTSLFPEK